MKNHPAGIPAVSEDFRMRLPLSVRVALWFFIIDQIIILAALIFLGVTVFKLKHQVDTAAAKVDSVSEQVKTVPGKFGF